MAAPQSTPASIETSHVPLLASLCSLPCSAAASHFQKVIESNASPFNIALTSLLPALVSQDCPVAARILSAYIIHTIYAPHSITLNPFYESLIGAFDEERRIALLAEKDSVLPCPNEQLVWVLWKILRGAGDDIAPFTANSLAKSALPAKLRPCHLTLNQGPASREPGSGQSSILDARSSSPPSPSGQEGRPYSQATNFIFDSCGNQHYASIEATARYDPTGSSLPPQSLLSRTRRLSTVNVYCGVQQPSSPPNDGSNTITSDSAVSKSSSYSSLPLTMPPKSPQSSRSLDLPQLSYSVPISAADGYNLLFDNSPQLRKDAQSGSVIPKRSRPYYESPLEQISPVHLPESGKNTNGVTSLSQGLHPAGSTTKSPLYSSLQLDSTPKRPSDTTLSGAGNTDPGKGEGDAVRVKVTSLLTKAKEKVLTLSEQKYLNTSVPSISAELLRDTVPPRSLAEIVQHNGGGAFVARIIIKILIGDASGVSSGDTGNTTLHPSAHNSNNRRLYLEAIRDLAPSLATFDLMGKLLRANDVIPDSTTDFLQARYSSDLAAKSTTNIKTTTVGDTVEIRVLLSFVSNCISVIDQWEEEEQMGLINDDRIARGVRLLCMFYNSLVNPGGSTSNAPGATSAAAAPEPVLSSPVIAQGLAMEMRHFALRYAKYEDAQSLYAKLSAWSA